MTLADRLRQAETKIAVRESEIQTRLADFRKAVAAARAASGERVKATKVHQFLSAFADSQREVVRSKIESAIGAALRSVFGPRMLFRIEVDVVRGQVVMRPEIGYRRRARVQWAGMDSVGGGVADVVSFVFRIAILSRLRPRLRRIVVADEPFKHVSESYLPRVAAMLRELAVSTGIQLIVVSHEPEIAAAAHRTFRVSMSAEGVSEVVPQITTP